jgi:hypothetical protein
MYIVRINKEKHSAWLTKSGALNQAKVLKKNGYKRVDIEYMEGLDLPDGHYFV